MCGQLKSIQEIKGAGFESNKTTKFLHFVNIFIKESLKPLIAAHH